MILIVTERQISEGSLSIKEIYLERKIAQQLTHVTASLSFFIEDSEGFLTDYDRWKAVFERIEK